MMDDTYYMKEALKEARKAMEADEVPIGAIVVCNGTIIGRGHNQTEMLSDVTAHAEIIALTAATQNLGGKYLNDATMYVTVEPCTMCAGALSWAQLGRLVYGASDEKRGYARLTPCPLHPKTEVSHGLMEAECKELVLQFFNSKRR
ncbi:MAG: nucleoside deaminase [Bacteroidia bacterium]|nr:nucleoside deaminase [Bacteroidia bacterium]